MVRKGVTKIWSKKPKGCPHVMVKAFSSVNYSVDTVLKTMNDVEVRTKWEDLFDEYKLLSTYKDYDLLYYKLKTPFGITSRDFLSRRTIIHNWPEEGATIIYMKSIEHELMPKRRKIIRAENLITGYILRRTGPDSCNMTIIS